MSKEIGLIELKRDLEAKYQRPIDQDIVLMIYENQSLYKVVSEAADKINTSQKVLQFQSDSQAFAFAFGKWGIYAVISFLLVIGGMITFNYFDSDLKKFRVIEKDGVRYIELKQADGEHFKVGQDYILLKNGNVIVPLSSSK